MEKYERFRAEAPVFAYRSYTINEFPDRIDVSWDFSIEGLKDFAPGWTFPKPEGVSVAGDLTFERLVFSLGMAEAVSYWKAACSPTVRIDCGELNDEQIKWWRKLWFMGLGEFFYVNKINADFSDFVTMIPNSSFKCTSPAERPAPSGCLVPIGGGKDSALTLETLTRAGMKCRCYAINKRNSISATVETAGLPESALITAQRRFDRTLLELNSAGYLNGHTPFSAIVAFSAEITAYLHGLRYIVLSNESSANESTVAGMEVNHQYSKSFEFERDFHEYEAACLGTGVYYFSFLRPLAEFQIAKMFVAHRKYLPVFRSCNLGSKVSPDIWCGECPKCLFVALILSPFLTNAELSEIFGRDMLADESMLNYFTELIGRSEHKPFECVGSVDEVILAVSLAIRERLSRGEQLPFLFAQYLKNGYYSPNGLDERDRACCGSYNEENLLPDDFKAILTNEMERLL